jgi:hypothetical protein
VGEGSAAGARGVAAGSGAAFAPLAADGGTGGAAAGASLPAGSGFDGGEAADGGGESGGFPTALVAGTARRCSGTEPDCAAGVAGAPCIARKSGGSGMGSGAVSSLA